LLVTEIAQTSSARAQPAVTEGRDCESIDSVPGSLTIRNASLASCIKWAYLVRDYQISGPAWLPAEKHDIAAKSGPKLHKAEPDSNTSMRGENGAFVFRGTSMPQFAEDLSTLSQVDRPVLDRTGIPGVFDFKRTRIAGDGVSIFTLIQEQLGWKRRKGRSKCS
jgi:hypothetical protein